MPLSPPGSDEFHSVHAGYIARVAHISAPADEFVAQRARLLEFLSSLSEQQAAFRYAPGKWSVKEMVGHLADAERIMSYRLLRIGRGDDTPLPGFEEDDYVRNAGSDSRSLADLRHEWSAVRDATIALVNGMPADAWERRGTANGAPVSARAIAYLILGHLEHHRSVLHERYALAPPSR